MHPDWVELMIASITQTVATVLVVVLAAAYLFVSLRRAIKGKGGCCAGSPCGKTLQDKADRPQQFVPLNNLVDHADQLAANKRESS